MLLNNFISIYSFRLIFVPGFQCKLIAALSRSGKSICSLKMHEILLVSNVQWFRHSHRECKTRKEGGGCKKCDLSSVLLILRKRHTSSAMQLS